MEILSILTPAETYLICENSQVQFNQMLKLTLADLLLKKVLRVEKRTSQVTLGDGNIELSYIMRGENWALKTKKSNELIFTNTFEQSPELEILFHQLVKIGFSNGRDKYYFASCILNKNEEIKSYFKRNILFRVFNPAPLNKSGVEMQLKLQKALKESEKQIIDAYHSKNKNQLLEIINSIGGNIYLLNGFDSEILKEIDDHLKKQEANVIDYGHGCAGYFGSYYETSDSFDSAFDSVSDSSGSGCGGDSGCSGCSGCGGCGS